MNQDAHLPSLLFRLNSLRASFSRAEKQVVNYILKNPNEVIRLSVSELAENSNVSDATVVRTCRSMGFDGYHDFKITLAQDIITPLQSINEEINSEDSIDTIIDKVFQGALHTLNFTHDTLKASSIESAVNSIMNAKRIYIIGLGLSHSVAIDLQHKLLRLGLLAFAFTDTHHQAMAATYLSREDVLFAISLSGSSIDIVECAKIAKANDSTVISLTNTGNSPLSKISDIKLFTASNETKYRMVGMNSRIAQMAIINSLYTIIATKIPTISENFHKIEKAIETKKY